MVDSTDAALSIPKQTFVFARPLYQCVRALPIVVLCALGGIFFILANPSLFWDDWVWIYQTPEENIRISKELGIWWAGYLSNAIYALEWPTTTLRVVAAVAWVIAGGAIAVTLARRRYVSPGDAFVVFLLFAACHAGLIRFLNSVAMYNVYIASFWVGFAVLAWRPGSTLCRLVSLPFFFLAFHLNSTLFLYLLVLLVLYLDVIDKYSGDNEEVRFRFSFQQFARDENFRGLYIANLARGFRRTLQISCRRNIIFIFLPAFFILIKYLTQIRSPFYDTYNSISNENNFAVIVKSFSKAADLFPQTIRTYFVMVPSTVPMLYITGFSIAAFLLLWLLPQPKRPSWRSSLALLLIGFAVFYLGCLPYLWVDKRPILTDFYESRHIIVANAGLSMALASVPSAILALIPRALSRTAVMVRNIVLSVLLGMSLSYGFYFSIDLVRDWVRQDAIVAHLQARQDLYRTFSTFIFVDEARGFRVGDRTILNYEYTGNLIRALATKQWLGISRTEYASLPTGVPLLKDLEFRRRYNLDDYDPHGRVAMITMRRSKIRASIQNMVSYALNFWRGANSSHEAQDYFAFHTATVPTEVDARLSEINRAAAALWFFRIKKGYFPPIGLAPAKISGIMLPSNRIDTTSRPIALNDFPAELRAYYTTKLTPCVVGGCGYYYMSDGIDFKLVYVNAFDFQYARQAYPDAVDPMRQAYGIWTRGAARW